MLKKLIFILLNPRGRITRKQFWVAWILILVIGVGLKQAKDNTETILLSITYLYMTITIYGKRLHDIGRSAWRLLWPFLVHGCSVIGSVYLLQLMFLNGVPFEQVELVSVIVATLPYIVWLVAALLIGVPHGEDRDNVYGTNPRDITARSQVLSPQSS